MDELCASWLVRDFGHPNLSPVWGVGTALLMVAACAGVVPASIEGAVTLAVIAPGLMFIALIYLTSAVSGATFLGSAYPATCWHNRLVPLAMLCRTNGRL